MENVFTRGFARGVEQIRPVHPMIRYWVFDTGDEEEAALAHQMAVVAEKNGMTANEMQHLFPAVLRMLKSTSNWSK